MLQPVGLDHVALKVTDMDRSLHFYNEVLGLKLLFASAPSRHGGRAATVGAGDQKIDLFSRSEFVEADKEKPVGVDHLCLVVEAGSAEELIDYLEEADVEIFWAPVTRHGSTSVYVFDPDGIHVELRITAPRERKESAAAEASIALPAATTV